MASLSGKKIVLGISGGIAAYKAAELVRALVKAGARVDVVMTKAATEFIGAVTLQSLSKNPVLSDLFDLENKADVRHVALADNADLAVIAPATAEVISALASGSAADVVKTVFLGVRCPTLLVPAMNVNMWNHPAVTRNVETLQGWGYRFLGPEEGELAEGYSALGRMSEPEAIVAQLEGLVDAQGIQRSGAAPTHSDLAGVNVLITAGPTREPIDAVRYLTNPSSGRMGYALAAAAVARGAGVTLVSGPSELDVPHGVKFVSVSTAREMFTAAGQAFAACQVFVATAAVSDFRPKNPVEGKIKKDAMSMSIELERNPDILAELARSKKAGQFCVGFAAETQDLEANAARKLEAKNLDLMVANDVSGGRGFGSETGHVFVLDAQGRVAEIGPTRKAAIAHELWDLIASRL